MLNNNMFVSSNASNSSDLLVVNNGVISNNRPVIDDDFVTIDEEPIVIPAFASLNIPATPNYINGVRANTNSFGTVDISDFHGDTTALIKHIGADFKAIRQHTYRQLPDGSYKEIKNNDILVNSKTGGIVGTNITDRYGIFDFDDGIAYYMSLINAISSKGYNVVPAYAKVYDGGARMFLQHEIVGAMLMGEPTKTYVSLITSHDKSKSFVLALSCVRLFCQNQISRCLKAATNKVSIRHSVGNSVKIEAEAQKVIEAEKRSRLALEQYCSSLASTKISEDALFRALAVQMNLEDLKTQRQVNNFTERAEQLYACYNQPDLNDWRGTAYGAYLAYADYQDHVVPARKTADATYVERNFDGNVALGKFIDTVVEMA